VRTASSWITVAILGLSLLSLVSCRGEPTAESAPAPVSQGPAGAPLPIRFSGTVEARRATTVVVPRLAGQTSFTLVITALAEPGSHVKAGDLIVEFDPQEQLRAALDRQAELVDLNGQIAKKRAEHDVARAADETALSEAERNVERAQLEVRKNDLVARVEAEKNTLALEEGRARLVQLRETAGLKRQAAAAELRILEIQRERAERALRYAEGNAQLMRVEAPFSGLVVLKQIYQGSGYLEVQEGQEVRAGAGIIDIVDPSAMQVRVRVPQSDVGLASPGQPAKVRLDAYPDLVFDGRVESIAPLGIASSRTPKVRSFTAIVAIHGTAPQLMPDLTASVEVVPGAGAEPARALPPAPEAP
jgi:multidrug resistance efflux pump